MSFFSSSIKIIFITALAFSLYSEGNSLARVKPKRKPPNCKAYAGRFSLCVNQVDPICAKPGRTYYNPCIFCTVVVDSKRRVKFWHYGKCRS